MHAHIANGPTAPSHAIAIPAHRRDSVSSVSDGSQSASSLTSAGSFSSSFFESLKRSLSYSSFGAAMASGGHGERSPRTVGNTTGGVVLGSKLPADFQAYASMH
ncbi:hypothetical protein HKX48_002930 [Thoreauomyces humboldtii]|nr:hypothetical protein HKX48_002930 [Thoreauomyces humboldtii]